MTSVPDAPVPDDAPAVRIAPFAPGDYDEAAALWAASEGVVLRGADSREAVTRYLARNPGLSFVARDGDGRLVGAVLAGHDGRRGYLHHLAVDPAHRRRGLGRALAQRSLDALAHAGITKCHLMVVRENAAAQAFWARTGWSARDDIVLMSRTIAGGENA